MSSGPGKTTGADLERALAGAEAILASVELRRSRLSTAAVAVLFVTAGVLVAGVAIAESAPQQSFGVAAAVVSALIACGVLLSWLAYFVSRRKEIRRREHDMIMSVNRIREVLPLVSAREHWGAAQEAAIRARIARFPIVAK